MKASSGKCTIHETWEICLTRHSTGCGKKFREGWLTPAPPYARSSPANRTSSFFGPTVLNQTITFC
jgi:hypothetical protein